MRKLGKKWLEICQTLNGSTQSKVFRNLVIKLYESLEYATNIISYGRTNSGR